jgi:hypothetical protein
VSDWSEHIRELERCRDAGDISELEFMQYKCEAQISDALNEFWNSTGFIPLVHVTAIGEPGSGGVGVSVHART